MARPTLSARKFFAQQLRFLYVLLLAFIPACSGGGCSSCSGVTPLPGGFVNEERIENAASVRITQTGFDFIQDNIGTIAANLVGDGSDVLEFQIPTSSGSIPIPILPDIDYTICPGGPTDNPKDCTVEIDLKKSTFSIDSAQPHNIQVDGYLQIRLQNLPISTDVGSLGVTLSGDSTCPYNQPFANIGVTVNIAVETDLDQTHARYGYTRIRIASLTVSKVDLENSLEFCGGFTATLVNFFTGLIVDYAYDAILDALLPQIEEQLCQKANPDVSPPCPTGTNDVSGTCRYGTSDSDACVSTVLGTDGHAELGGLLAGISPGAKGGMDFLFAAGGATPRNGVSGETWGDLNPVGFGGTLSMFGGVEPNPVSGCVPFASVVRPSGLLIPDALVDDSLITDWPAGLPGPHIGFGISESFFNYALAGMYNSGLLCIGFSTDTIDLLNSSTLGLLAQSLRDLGLQREPQPIAIVLKPTKPPHVTFGNGTNGDTDPLIRLDLEQAGFDFYIVSSDRYIRFMTATFDISAPINLTVTPDGLVPTLTTLSIANGKVSNNGLLREDPAAIAATLQSLLSSQIGTLIGSGLPAVDLNGATSSLGLRLVIPETVDGQGSPGLRMLEKDAERYLAIFAALEVAPTMMSLETDAEIGRVRIDPDGLKGATLSRYNAPEVEVQVEVVDDFGKPVEHQLRVDGGIWRPWTRDRTVFVKDEALRLQGKHKIEVRSRHVGDAYSLDPTPAVLEVVVDIVPPEAKLLAVTDDGQARLDVFDLVSADATLVRFRFDDEPFGNWVPARTLEAIDIPEDATEIEVEAKDESENVGTSRQAIIRGLPHDSGGGCGCAVPGKASPGDAGRGWPAGLAALLAMSLLALRRARLRQGTSKGLGAFLLGGAGRQIATAGVVLVIGGTWSGCSCDEETLPDNYSCKAPGCVTLEPGLIGEYTSTAVDKAGDLWVAGYLEANWDQVYQYGDLVVGKWDGEKVAWTIVDGVPTEPPVDDKAFNRKGFRGGQTAAGDDVGLWTSIAIDPVSGDPMIAYYDRTNKALKVATYTGVTWSTEVVDGGTNGSGVGSDAGRYAKLLFDGNTPVIAYMTLEPVSDGFPSSRVRLARGGSSGFTTEDVFVNDATPCRAATCNSGSKCVADDGRCASPSSGCAACAMGEECVSLDGLDTCVTTLGSGKLDSYPMGGGLYISMAAIPGGGLGIAYYDRVIGTLNVAAKESSGWTSVVVDGGPQMDGGYLDAGIGASLFIDDGGDWHLAYVDGHNEALKYAKVAGGAVDSIEVVDDGLSASGVPFSDGLHVVGDDSFIRVGPQGDVRITYQDATDGRLRYAVGTPTATGHDWDVKIVESPELFGGFFSSQVTLGGAEQLVHWWRRLGPDAEGAIKMTGDVSVVALP